MKIKLHFIAILFLVFNYSFGQFPSIKKLNIFEDLPIITPNQKNLIKMSPDGQYLITKGSTGLNIWDYKTEKVIKYLPFEDSFFQKIEFSSDGKYMASIEVEQITPDIISSIRVWQTSNWTKLINLGRVSKTSLSNFCFSIDNTQVYTIENGSFMNGSCMLKCYNLSDGKLINLISLPEWSRFENVKAIDKNHLLVSGDNINNVVKLIDLSAKRLLRPNEIITLGNGLRSDSLLSFYTKKQKFYQNLDTNTGEVKSYPAIQPGLVDVLSNNKLFLAQMVKNEQFQGLKVWNLNNQKELYSKELRTDGNNNLVISDDSKYVFLGDKDTYFYKFKYNDTLTIKQVTGGNSEGKIREEYKDMVFIENQKLLAIATSNDLLIYDLQNEKILKSIKSNSIVSLKYSSKTNSLLIISENTNIQRLNLSDFTQKNEQNYSFLNDAIESNNKFIAIGNKVANKARLFDINDLSVRNVVGDGSGLSGVSLISFSNDNLMFATNQNGNLTLWETETGKKMKHFPNFHRFYINAMTFSKDNKSIISSGGGEYKIRITNIDDANNVKYLDGHKKFIRNLCVSNDGEYLFSSSSDNTVKMWDLAQNKLVKTIFEGTYKIVKILLSTDGKSLYVLDNYSVFIVPIP